MAKIRPKDHTFSFFKGGIKNTKKSIPITIQEAFKIIRSERLKEEVERLRNATDKSVRNVIKNKLDVFTFSGVFTERKVDGLEKHSGFICIDFDHLEDLNKVKYFISLDSYTHLLFISPSGDGLKIVIKINPEQHAESFKDLQEYYLNKYGLELDKSGKDVSRACFASYDEYAYYNPDSTVFEGYSNMVITESGNIVDNDTGEVIVENDNPFKGWDRKKKLEFDRIKEVVKRVVQKKTDITGEYDDWRDIGFSLAIFGELARELYHEISQFHLEYNREDCDKKFDDFVKNGRFKTPARFYIVCKAYNIDTRVVKEIEPGIAEGAEGKEYENWKLIVPEGCEVTSELKAHTYNHQFIEVNSCYYFAEYDNKTREIRFHAGSNFVIYPLFLITSRLEPKRIIEIENCYGLRKMLEIPAKAFVSQSEFNAFVEGKGHFLNEFTKTQFHKVKNKIYNMKNAEEIKVLGWHKDGFYSFANGIYTNEGFIPTDDYGIVKYEEKNYFIPALSSVYKEEEEEMQDQKKFVFVRNKLKFDEWAGKFINVYKDNGKIGLIYFVTSMFRDIIYHHFKFFPHIFLFGPPGTGKSTMAWSYQYMFGEPQGPFFLGTGTQVAFFRKFASFRNSIAWFDEYSNSIDPKRIQSLKGAYDGSSHEKSEDINSNRTKKSPVNSACTISGQELPIADNALFKRCILLQYYQTEFSDEERKALDDFRALQANGLSLITAHLTTLRPIIEQNYFEAFEKTIKEVKEIFAKEKNIEERIIQNMCILITMCKVLHKYLKFPFTYEEFKAVAIDNVIQQTALISHAKETSMFWDLVEFMLDDNEIKEGEDFRVEPRNKLKVQIGKEEREIDFYPSKEILFIRLSKIHPLYLESHRRQYNKNGMDKGSLVHYLLNTKECLGAVNSMRFSNSKSSCYAFDYEALKASGLNLDRDKKTPISDEPGTSESEEDLPF